MFLCVFQLKFSKKMKFSIFFSRVYPFLSLLPSTTA